MFWCTGLESTHPSPLPPTCEESFHSATFPLAFWTQTIFDTGLVSLGLVSQKNVGVRFPQLYGTNMYRRVVSLSLISQKLVGDTFPSASWYQHVQQSRFTRP